MPEPQPLTPEENLLRHIRNNKKESVAASDGGLAARPSAGVARPISEPRVFAAVNRTLILCILLTIGYGIYDMMVNAGRFQLPRESIDLPRDIKPVVRLSEEAEPKPFEYYAEEIRRKEIFAPIIQDDQAAASDSGQNLSGAGNTLNLKLVGIVIDEESEAIVIDLDSKQTHFLKIGDAIQGARVEEINEGRVELKRGNDVIELVQ